MSDRAIVIAPLVPRAAKALRRLCVSCTSSGIGIEPTSGLVDPGAGDVSRLSLKVSALSRTGIAAAALQRATDS